MYFFKLMFCHRESRMFQLDTFSFHEGRTFQIFHSSVFSCFLPIFPANLRSLAVAVTLLLYMHVAKQKSLCSALTLQSGRLFLLFLAPLCSQPSSLPSYQLCPGPHASSGRPCTIVKYYFTSCSYVLVQRSVTILVRIPSTPCKCPAWTASTAWKQGVNSGWLFCTFSVTAVETDWARAENNYIVPDFIKGL